MTKWQNPYFLFWFTVMLETNLAYAVLHQDFNLIKQTSLLYKAFSEAIILNNS